MFCQSMPGVVGKAATVSQKSNANFAFEPTREGEVEAFEIEQKALCSLVITAFPRPEVR